MTYIEVHKIANGWIVTYSSSEQDSYSIACRTTDEVLAVMREMLEK